MTQPDHEQGISASQSTSTETSPLLVNTTDPQTGAESNYENAVDQKTIEEALDGEANTTWQKETTIIIKSAGPLIVTFFLQYSILTISVISIGHIGKTELGGVSIGMLTANVTGYVVFLGMATSLDTLCAQAYGSGKKELVGLHMQRMLALFSLLSIPIAIIWFFSGYILAKVIPDKEVAHFAGLYLRILIFGIPGYFSYECGKRFVQAQGLFSASTYVMLLCAPLNAFMSWLLVWKLKLGFIGAPIAIVITHNMLPLCLILYVTFIGGSKCWGGFTRAALSNWGPMIRLAIPGYIMLQAEFCAFSISTLAAAQINTNTLAAQAVLHNLVAVTFQIPFPIGIASSVRIGNLIGASLPNYAKIAARVGVYAATSVGLLNVIILSTLRHKVPYLFTSDPVVVSLAAKVMPLIAMFTLLDATGAATNGILRGLGRQKFGSYLQLGCYYLLGIPIGLSTAFKLGWGLWGLWAGVAVGMAAVVGLEVVYVRGLDWGLCVQDAVRRNERG